MLLARSMLLCVSSVHALTGIHVETAHSLKKALLSTAKKGDKVTISIRKGITWHVQNSTNVTTRDVAVHSASMFGLSEFDGGGGQASLPCADVSSHAFGVAKVRGGGGGEAASIARFVLAVRAAYVRSSHTYFGRWTSNCGLLISNRPDVLQACLGECVVGPTQRVD
jgi:hypothetical protein